MPEQHRVRQRAEQILEILQSSHERGTVRQPGLHRLQQVAQALGGDARGVQLGWIRGRRRLAEPPGKIGRVLYERRGRDRSERRLT